MNSRQTRRQFLQVAATAAATTAQLAVSSAHAAPSGGKLKPSKAAGLIDTNVTLGCWPFRRLPLDDTPALVAKLHQHGVTQAWAGTFDALFHKDLAAANERLAEDCRRRGRGLLVPFGSVNLNLPDWEDDLRRCHERYQMPGLRLYPTYHGYKLDEPAFAKLLTLALARRLVVQIIADLEDERTQHPLARVPHLDAKPLLALLQSLPGARVVLLNWFRSVNAPLVKQLAAAGVSFDIATLEGVGGVAKLIQQIGVGRIMFGSHALLFYFESALLKLKESALSEVETLAVRTDNARAWLRPAGGRS